MKLTLSPEAKEIATNAHPVPAVPPQSAPVRALPPNAPSVARTPPVAFLANVAQPVANLCIKAVALCRQIAPLDLAGLPVYVVPQSAIAAKFGNAASTYGYTMSWLDWILRNEIGTSWQGRGPCMVINDIAMREDTRGNIEAVFLSSVLHELAHILEREMRYDSTPDISPQRVQFEQTLLADELEHPIPEPQKAQSRSHHNHRFIRTLLHLRCRAEEYGARLAPLNLADHGSGRPSIEYLIALQRETEQLFNISIRAVLDVDPPPGFLKLCAADHTS